MAPPSPRRWRRAAERIEERALLLRAVPIGEADLVVTLLTASRGVLAAAARGGRKSSRRFGALEPMHELAVTIDLREGVDVGTLVEARIERLRSRLTRSLERLDAAGRLLRWTRRGSPASVPEPEAFAVIAGALDLLDVEDEVDATGVLGAAGLDLLDALGWGLDLERCVACGKPCPEGSPASVDPVRGGLVCRACGGARRVLPAALRARVLAARGGGPALDQASTVAVVELIEAVLDAHVAPGVAQPPRGR